MVAWLVAQVLQLIFESFGSPDWVMKSVLVLLAAGLPFVLFFAWAFELTPEGLKREHEVDRSQSVTPQTGKKLDRVIIGVLVLALGYFALDKFVLSTEREAALVEATTQALTEKAEVAGQAVDADKSIAVLPFVNMSEDKSNEYFSDGLSEELLNLLAKIPNLRVIARTSSFAYKGTTTKIADVARELNVAHVLEGSVRKSGNQVRITAQLVRASDSSHLWSESYDRSLDDVFAIQDEISAAVVEQLKIKLLGAAPKAKETDPAAYVLTLQARQLLRQGKAEGFAQSIALYQQALAIAPDYATAWAGLSDSYSRQADKGMRPIAEGYTLAREAADKALAIDPDNAAAHAQLGIISMAYDRDLAAAAQHFERALQLDPANPDIFLDAVYLTASLGRTEEAVALAEYVVSRDPVNAVGQYRLGLYYRGAGRPEEAMASLRTALSLSPGRIAAQTLIGFALLSKGEPENALVAMQQESAEGWRLVGLTMAYHALGRAPESDAALSELMKDEQGWAYNIAYVLAYRGEADRAFEWLDKAVQYKDPGLAQIPTQIEFTNIHKDPRWLPFLESIGKSPAQLGAIEFKVTLPE